MGGGGLDAIKDKGNFGGTIKEDPLRPREQTFLVKYKAPDGQEYEGDLVSRILNNDERMEVNRIATRLAGVPWDRIPPVQAARIWALSSVSVQLRDTPGWAKTWIPEDDTLLFSVFGQCELHDSEFFRSGGGTGTEGTETSRVSITPNVVTSAAPE